MSLSIGIVGLPNVGKSTLFNALTKKQAEASNYPFCTIDPNVGVVKVPDERLQKLSDISKSKKILPTTIEFVDIAGLVSGAHKGEGLGNKFLSHIRECDAICEVVREFKDDNIIHVNGKIDPEGDRETINLELIFADLATVEKMLAKTSREARGGDKEVIKLNNVLEKLKQTLENGKPARELVFEDASAMLSTSDEQKILNNLNLLSSKPIIYVLNTNDNTLIKSAQEKDIDKDWDGSIVQINSKLEEEIASLPEEDQTEYIKELGLDESGLDKLIRASYDLLGLITFLTTGPEETRAWTIRKGEHAPQAAGVIHTDFEKGFIRAEVVNWEQFVEAGGETEAREKGLIRTEGKDYLMQDGDVCHFLHN